MAHKRLLTRAALVQMLEDCGYTVDEVAPVGVPFDAVVGGPVGFALERASDALARLWPTLFAFQFLVVCRPLPSARQLLGSAERRHVSRATAAQLDAAAEVGAARED